MTSPAIQIRPLELTHARHLSEMLNLTQRLPDKPENPLDYLNHILEFGYGLAIFIAVNAQDVVVGYIHVEAPGWLDDKTGWIVSCVNTAGLSVSRRLLAAACAWLKSNGATRVQMLTTVRSCAWTKAFGFKPSPLVCYEKEL